MTTRAIEADVPYVAEPLAPASSMFERASCPSCAASDAIFFIEAEDDLTGRPGRFTFVRCAQCDLVYQSPRLTLEYVKPYYDDNYIAHQERGRWGWMAPAVAWAMGSLDRAKLSIVSRYVSLGPRSQVLDVGCGAASFLTQVRERFGAAVAGVDFVDLSSRPAFRGVEFHHGLFYEQEVGRSRFDLITMWHFLEHDYDPLRSLRHAADALAPGGRLIVEVPRLDSLSFRWFGHRWPGLQAPQHTAVYDRAALSALVSRAGLIVEDYLPYGAFPPYFYAFCGAAFHLRPGRGLDLRRAVVPYFAGQLLLLPILPLLKHANFAMQTVVCRKET
jgi:SAM-dependent methyltransferase